jgi:hypothetical protein
MAFNPEDGVVVGGFDPNAGTVINVPQATRRKRGEGAPTISETAPGEFSGSATLRPAPGDQYGTVSPREARLADRIAILKGAFTGARDAIAAPLAVAEGAIRAGGDLIGAGARKLIPGANLTGSSEDWAPNGFIGAVKDAYSKRGEGLRGMGDNPINIAALLPGLAPARLAAATGATGVGGRVLATLIGAGEGGAMGGLQAANEDQPVLPAIGRGALASALFTGAGQAMNKWGEHKFPGLGTIPNPKVTEASKQMVREALPDILSAGALPKSDKGFAELAESMRRQSGAKFEAAKNAVPSEWAAPVSDLEKAAEANLLNRLASRERMAAEFRDGVPAIPQSPADELAARFNSARATQAHELQDPDWLNAQQLGMARTAGTDPRLYQNPVGSAAMMAKDVGGAFHDALTDALMGAPNYAATLGPTAQKEYALSKALSGVVASPGRLGLSHRAPVLNLAINPWMYSSALYKTGNALQSAALPSAALSGYLSGPTTESDRKRDSSEKRPR